jgi:hypothetical protein
VVGQVLAVVLIALVLVGVTIWRVWDDVRLRLGDGADPESLSLRSRWFRGFWRD